MSFNHRNIDQRSLLDTEPLTATSAGEAAPPGQVGFPRRARRCTCVLVVDVLLAMLGATLATYGSFCLAFPGGDNEGGVCIDALYVFLLEILGVCLLLRPIWLVLMRCFRKRRCKDGVLYYACRKWSCCGGCGPLFPLLAVCNIAMLMAACSIENSVIIGVTNGEPAEPISSTFFSGQDDTWSNGNYYSFFLALIFNVVVPVLSLTLMVVR
eukprot:SAG22_NODE_2443_length_2565_cov_3.317924_3_plen_211_part_00